MRKNPPGMHFFESRLTPLLLQQPAGKPSYKKNKEHLERRLSLWHAGDINALVLESATIQKQLISSNARENLCKYGI